MALVDTGQYFHPHLQYRNPQLQYANPRNFFAGIKCPHYFRVVIVNKQHRFPESGMPKNSRKIFTLKNRVFFVVNESAQPGFELL
jgi:hypothetical protein